LLYGVEALSPVGHCFGALEASLRRCRAGASANCHLWHSALHTLAALILVTCSSASHATRISGCFNSSALGARLHPFVHFANGDCCSTKAGARCTDVCRPRPVTRPKNKVYGLTSLMCLVEASDRHVLQLVYHCGQQVQSSWRYQVAADPPYSKTLSLYADRNSSPDAHQRRRLSIRAWRSSSSPPPLPIA